MSERFELERVSLILLMNCNLKCKGCCVQAPYYAHKYYPSLNFIKAEIDRLFRIADKINFFSVEGGEALLRKDFGKILAHLAMYKEQIGVEVPIVTNGTIVPDQETIDAAKQLGDKARFIVDNYGTLSNKIADIEALLVKNSIRHTIRNYDNDAYCGGWVDLYGNYEKKHNEADAKKLHSKCAWVQKLKGVIEIIGGQIYFCPVSRVFFERGLAVMNDEKIDFMAERPIDDIRKELKALFEKPALAACQFCNGIHDESERFQPAVQLTDEELRNAYLSTYRYREEL